MHVPRKRVGHRPTAPSTRLFGIDAEPPGRVFSAFPDGLDVDRVYRGVTLTPAPARPRS